MGDATSIDWTDSTFSPWEGCTKISPACDHCYAETRNNRFKKVVWGPHGERKRTTSTWSNPLRWQKGAAAFRQEHGRRRRVFCASLSDVFDNQAPLEWREDLFTLIRRCPDLDWQLLTKRPQNMTKFLPPDWGDGYPNVWLGVTAESQPYFDQRWPILARTSAIIRFISAEPLLGHIDIGDARPDWTISGGESGPGFRPLDMDAVRSLRDQCARNGIAFHHKQNGGLRPKATGCLIDGVEHKAFPLGFAA